MFVQIFRLEPKVRGLESADKEPESSVKEEVSARQKADRMNELTSLYGTKKSIKEVSEALTIPLAFNTIIGSFHVYINDC